MGLPSAMRLLTGDAGSRKAQMSSFGGGACKATVRGLGRGAVWERKARGRDLLQGGGRGEISHPPLCLCAPKCIMVVLLVLQSLCCKNRWFLLNGKMSAASSWMLLVNSWICSWMVPIESRWLLRRSLVPLDQPWSVTHLGNHLNRRCDNMKLGAHSGLGCFGLAGHPR